MSKWIRSLRVRLQIWHALILLCVVLGFGFVLYGQIVHSRWDDIDAELLSTGRILEGSLRTVPRPILDSLAQDIGSQRLPPPPPRRPPNDPLNRRAEPPDGPPMPGFFPPGRGQLEWDRPPGAPLSLPEDWERRLSLPRSLPEQLARGESIPAYFVIWRRDGSILRQVDVPYENPVRPDLSDLTRNRRHFHLGRAGPLREVFVRGPQDSLICVGRGVGGEEARFRRLAMQLTLAGTLILGGGLCGGWWLSGRAIAPIERMSQTAAAINAANLSERMDLSGVDLELERLGSVLNNMLQRLETAFSAQRRFTADASHELRTPLAVMLSTIELSLSKPRAPEEYREQLLKCQRAALRMRGLVDSLLTLTRVDSPADTSRRQPVVLHGVAQEAIDALIPLAEQQHVELNMHLEPATVLGDETELGQVITNLTANAITYNRPGGRVTVEVKREVDLVRLSVSDTGIGIPAADLPHIFERFYRVDAARSRRQGGSGLGLAICERIVAAHGGMIEVQSQPDAGSTFTVRLPSA